MNGWVYTKCVVNGGVLCGAIEVPVERYTKAGSMEDYKSEMRMTTRVKYG